MLSAARQCLPFCSHNNTITPTNTNSSATTSCSSACEAATSWEGQHAGEDKRKAQFLVAIHVLYFVGTLPSLIAHHYFVPAEAAVGDEVDRAAMLMRWASLSFYPFNLLVFQMTGHLRLAVFLFLCYSQAVLLCLCEEGQPHGTEYLCFVLFAVASVHVVGKTLGMCLLTLIMLEVTMLESRAEVIRCSGVTPHSLPASLLRLSIVLCTCLTSLVHKHLHGDAALRLQKCMDQRMKFFALISHDLRAPLQSINYVASDLLQKELPHDVRAVVDVVQESSEHLLCLLNNLLELSRVQLGSLDLRLQRFNIAYELEKLMRPFKVAAGKKNILLRCHVDLSHSSRRGDPIRFRQVMDNLLSNAIKFTREGGRVEVLAREVVGQPDRIHVEVIDNGIGIDAGVADSLFKCFTQGDSELENSRGFGLGLAICKKICQAMDGHISVESELRKGSKFCFEVRLPIYSPEADEDDDAASSGDEHSGERPSTEEGKSRLQGKRILLVEDSKLLQMTLGRMLSHLGCVVETAWNGAEAMELLELKDRQACDSSEGGEAGGRGVQGRRLTSCPFDAVLCDIHMPGLDGYHTAQAIRKWEKARREGKNESENETESEERSGETGPAGQLPVVGMSASMLNGEERKCHECGMDDFLLKPPRIDQLQRCLDRWIGRDVDREVRAAPRAKKSRKARRTPGMQPHPPPQCVT